MSLHGAVSVSAWLSEANPSNKPKEFQRLHFYLTCAAGGLAADGGPTVAMSLAESFRKKTAITMVLHVLVQLD